MLDTAKVSALALALKALTTAQATKDNADAKHMPILNDAAQAGDHENILGAIVARLDGLKGDNLKEAANKLRVQIGRIKLGNEKGAKGARLTFLDPMRKFKGEVLFRTKVGDESLALVRKPETVAAVPTYADDLLNVTNTHADNPEFWEKMRAALAEYDSRKSQAAPASTDQKDGTNG